MGEQRMITTQELIENGPHPFINWLKEQPEDHMFCLTFGGWEGGKPRADYGMACPLASWLMEQTPSGSITFTTLDISSYDDIGESWLHHIQELWSHEIGPTQFTVKEALEVITEDWVAEHANIA